MTLLIRSDGTPFVIQAYRESLTLLKRSDCLKKLRSLAGTQGQYLRLFKKDDETLETVLSHDSGYLLAESVWHFFNKPKHLIYCEAEAKSAHMLLIIVKEGVIYFDRRITSSELRAELIPLMSGEQAYRIVTYGEIPLRQAKTLGGATFTFPKKLIERFEILDEPVLEQLEQRDEYQLQPLVLALKSEHLRNYLVRIISLVCIFLLALGFWFLVPSLYEQPKQSSVATKKINDPYLRYRQALSSVSPAKQLDQFVVSLQGLYLLPGWQVSQIQLQQTTLRVQMHETGGSLEWISRWSKQHGYYFQINQSDALLTKKIKLDLRRSEKKVVSLQSSMMQLLDRMHSLLVTQRDVQVGTITSYKMVKSVAIRLTVHDAAPVLLTLLGQQLKGLPIVLSNIDVNVNNGLLSGTIQLSLWGS